MTGKKMRSPLRRNMRGFGLLLVLLVVAVCSVVAFAGVSIATLDSQTEMFELNAMHALNFARVGVFRAMSQLRVDNSWGSAQSYTYSQNGGSYTLSVYPAPGNQTGLSKLWKVTSTGSYGSASRTVVCWLAQESFSRFAYFSNSETSPTGTAVAFVNADRITGAAHTNGFYTISGNPQFGDRVTSANQGDADYDAGTFSYSQGGTASTDPAKFFHYRTSYAVDAPAPLGQSASFGFYGGQPTVALPTDSSLVKSKADLLLTGDATLIFSGGQTVTVKQAGLSDRVVSTASVTIYVDQGTASVSGTVSGRVTVGASTGIIVTASLLYANRATDVLGLITDGNVTISTSTSTVADLEIDAAIMAPEGCFTVNSYSSGVARGTLHVFGAIIQNQRGPVGTYNSSTGTITTGYAKDYVFDSKLTNLPPLNFPQTGNILIRSFLDSGTLGT